ncbi:[nucleotide sugar/triose phosphate] transporter, putative [Candida dubliniensis CD36]|uniref:GDP-mannose transporter n=1 Tax=Candida dubliniensis (strain CD36 / ATCC MYA-646 / CBS 7987 / NCPF 3949 / NRRL Y-17841) TaxID=573826 RepID=B9WKB1_CANDC|nr:[nucleotide sugar/triose phosphate] transporter, putative [Candida dubliniensis CD36]CAX40763.1 [nucleotide sugar/triose phosphate] transporter, putative [Candida dubliniensis CD36]
MQPTTSEESSGVSTRESFEFEIEDDSLTNNSTPSRVSIYGSKTIESIIYILGWYFFSLSISIYNKWMFGSGLDFKFPIIITSFHQLCLCILSCVVLYLKPNLRPLHITNVSTPISTNGISGQTFNKFLQSLLMDFPIYIKQIFPCSIASAGDIGLSNVSISLITLSLYTMLKTSSLMFVLLFGLLFKLEKFNWRLIFIVGIMTISVIMMTDKPPPPSPPPQQQQLAITTEEEKHTNNNNQDFSSIGIFMVLLASMLSGLRWSFTQILLKKNPYTPNSISTIFYISPGMCIILFLLGLIFEGWTNFINSEIWITKGLFTTIILLIIPGILAFMMTLCEFKLLTVAQIITLSVAGIFKELLTIILSSIIFGDKLSFINILGLILTFMDILWYNYYRYYENEDNNKATIREDLER